MITHAWLPECIDGRRVLALTLERREVIPLALNTAVKRTRHAAERELKDWRAWAADEAKGGPRLHPPVDVVVEHLRKTAGSMPDTCSPVLAYKAMLDGVVEAGLLPGDSPAYVHRVTFEPPLVVGYHGLRVTLTERPPESGPTGVRVQAYQEQMRALLAVRDGYRGPL